MLILAGDVGGTSCRFAIFERMAHGLVQKAAHSVPSAEVDDLADELGRFVSGFETPCDRACLGIAGPVSGRTVTTTNLPWTLDADELARRLEIEHIGLLNDLEATAHSLDLLPTESVTTLAEGDADAVGNRAVLAVGTGLGEAGLYWDGRRHHPFATEGGHAAFSPSSDDEAALLRHLRRRFGRVSWERVLSGPGLVELYRYVATCDGITEPAWLRRELTDGDPAAAITSAGLDGRSRTCRKVLEMFVRLGGAEAANLALKIMARGGIWIAGGIAPRILPFLESGAFLESFLAAGRMQKVLERVPVKVILDENAPLLGAAHHASTTAGQA